MKKIKVDYKSAGMREKTGDDSENDKCEKIFENTISIFSRLRHNSFDRQNTSFKHPEREFSSR